MGKEGISTDPGSFDPEAIPRPVSAVGMELVTDGFEQPRHSHRKGQLILAVTGLITCDAASGLWLVPGHCALWVPGGLEHSVRAVGHVELYVLFLDPHLAAALPSDCCTVSISPLLRELIVAAARLPKLYNQNGPPGRLIRTMIDQLAIAPIERLHLPLPADPRLRRIADALAAEPANRATIAQWGRFVAMSERTLLRLTLAQTGMSFGRWRQQFQIMFALKRLAEGATVQVIAFDLGYEGASSFITMFKKALGQSPARYLAGLRRERPNPA